MNGILTYVLGVVACSGLFLAFYRSILYMRTSFRTARVFLVGSLVAATAIPAFDLPVWKSAPVEIAAVSIDATAGEALKTAAEAGTGAHSAELWQTAVLIVYLAGAAGLLSAILYQFIRIHRMKRRARIDAADGCEVAVCEEIAAPFSFLSTVYVGEGTPPGELRQILIHESSHIRHRHSVEKIIAELLKALVWFNPFAWISSRLLNEVHEFEADSDVLRSGCTVEEYLPVIFKQVFGGYIPEISTGLGNSLTKKRFQMMTRDLKHRRYSWLRTAGVLPVAAAMLMLFGFTHRPPEIILTGTETDGISAAAPDSQPQDSLQGSVAVRTNGKASITLKGSSSAAKRDSLPADIFIWDGSLNRRITTEEMKMLKPEEIKDISIWKGESIPDDVRQMIGDPNVKELIVINSGKDLSGGTENASPQIRVASRKAGSKPETQPGTIVVRHDKSVTGERPFIWLSGSDPREITDEEMGKFSPDMIESVSILKNGRDQIPEDILKAIGDRSFNGVVIIRPKENNTLPYYDMDKAFIWLSNENREISQEDMSNIATTDIKSISILKDEASYPKKIRKAMKGREFEGVIMITLKE